MAAWLSEKLNLKSIIPGRGGSSMIEANGSIYMFGGANRECVHFNDMWKISTESVNGSTDNCKLDCGGDVPQPRSGHTMVAFGNYILLFGGVDFSEEVAYNDIYTLDLVSFEWKYVGEAGVEIPGRNSHSMGIVGAEGVDYLVIYGGASPELGILQDTYYAALPADGIVNSDEFYLTFVRMTEPTSSTSVTPYPRAREMQSTCIYAQSMFITGGRSMAPQGTSSAEDLVILNEVWMLAAASSGVVTAAADSSNVSDTNSTSAPAEVVKTTGSLVSIMADGRVIPNPKARAIETNSIAPPLPPSEASTTPAGTDTTTLPVPPAALPSADSSVKEDVCPLKWIRCRTLDLPSPRCSHSSCIVRQEDADSSAFLCTYGGFSGESISTDFEKRDISMWYKQYSDVCQARLSGTPIVPPTKKSTPWTTVPLTVPISGRFGLSMCTAKADTNGSDNRKPDVVMLFGGVDSDFDYSDMWVLRSL